MSETRPPDRPLTEPIPPKRESQIIGSIEYFWIGDEQDSQCARCGSSTYPVDCWNCGGEGFLEDDDDWADDDSYSTRRCDICGGDGGWQRCCSSREWCEAHPMPGREAIKSSARENWEGEDD